MRTLRNKHLGCCPEWLLWLVATAVLSVAMQWTQEYRFYAKEAEHLWLNDSLWIGQWLSKPGGLAQLATSALTQFFGLWWVGAVTMAALLGAIYCGGVELQRRLQLPAWLTGWWLLPVAFMLLCQENGYYSLRGTVAVAIAVWTARIYLCRPSMLLAVVLPLAVYWIAGSAGCLLAVMIAVCEVLSQRHWGRVGLAVLSAVVAAGIGVRQGAWISMEEALTPAQYYEWPSTYFLPLYAWISLALLPLAGWLIGQKGSMALGILGLVVPLAVGVVIYRTVHNPKIYLLREDEWRASQEDWDGIIAAHQGLALPTPFMSYLNLALAQKGQLVERMGEFHPYVAWSDEAQRYSPVLMTQHELSRDALKLQSCVCWAWGGSALCNAQKAAFEANFLTPGMTDPVELQRQVITNSIFETPEVAQKYLRRLSRTTMHHAWADSMLHDPARLQAEVDALAEQQPTDDAFYLKTQVGRLLRQIAMQTPQNRVAAQFYEAYLIQSRDTVAYRHWREFSETTK